MKRNHLSIILGMALIALLMGSCDAMFENQFGKAGLGKPSDADIAAQANDPDPAIAQPALALQVEAELDAGGGTALVENLVDVLLTQGASLNNLDGSASSMNDFIEALIPANLLDDPAAFAAAIDAIANTLPALTTLAGTVSGDSYAVEGLNTQNLAMTAALATVFDTLDPVGGYATTGEALAAFYTDSQSGSVNIASYIGASSADFDTLFASGSTVGILFGAAGVNFDELKG